jgi:hypothetical protein
LILYLDTSSLVKLYVEETGSPEVEGLADKASLLCTSVIAYPEARSALARLHRGGAFHLASFLHLQNAELGDPIHFSSFDDRLNAAASRFD